MDTYPVKVPICHPSGLKIFASINNQLDQVYDPNLKNFRARIAGEREPSVSVPEEQVGYYALDLTPMVPAFVPGMRYTIRFMRDDQTIRIWANVGGMTSTADDWVPIA